MPCGGRMWSGFQFPIEKHSNERYKEEIFAY